MNKVSVNWIMSDNMQIARLVNRFEALSLSIYIYIVFANGPGDLGSIPGCALPKTFKMVLDTSLLNTWQYKVCIKGKMEQSRERSSALPYTFM